jgi:hypothetical protein
MVLILVVLFASGTMRRMQRTSETEQSTGHRKGSPVRFCVQASIFFPLFWSTKMIVTYLASLSRLVVLCSRVFLVVERKMTPPRTITFVFPGPFCFVYLQAQQAKKEEPRTRSAVTLGALLQSAAVSAPDESKGALSSREVMAFC